MHATIVSRSQGRSVVSVAAYNAGERLRDIERRRVIDRRAKTEVVHSEINLCEHAPEKFLNREILWNSVQQKESFPNAQLARNIEFALPRELCREDQIEMVRAYVMSQFVSQGMIADWSLHDKGDGNPHCHLLLTMRGIQQSGEWAEYKMRSTYKLDADGNKIPKIDPATGKQMIRDRRATGKGIERVWERINLPATPWNSPKMMEKWRAAWADVCNERLTKIEKDCVDHRSFERQGIERIPAIHEGWEARNLEKRGEISDRCQENRRIVVTNFFLNRIGSRIENQDLVRFVMTCVDAIGNKITAISDMVGSVAKSITEEILKITLLEKIRRDIYARGDLGRTAGNTEAIKRTEEAARGGVDAFLGQFEAKKVDSREKDAVVKDESDGRRAAVKEEPDPIVREDLEYEGRIDRGI